MVLGWCGGLASACVALMQRLLSGTFTVKVWCRAGYVTVVLWLGSCSLPVVALLLPC